MDRIDTSVLRAKAIRRDVRNIARADPDVQVAIFRDTLVYLEKYLDTGDLRKLSPRSLGFILDDILKIIERFRDLKPKLDIGTFGSVDGVLEKLRDARDKVQVALGMFNKSSELKETRSGQFFATLRLARENIEAALRLFRRANGKE